MAKHKDILNTMAADDLAPQGARASTGTQQYGSTQDMSINQVTYQSTYYKMNTN